MVVCKRRAQSFYMYWTLNAPYVYTYSTRMVRESSSVRAGACSGPGGSCEVSSVTWELLAQPAAVHALSTKKWVE